MYTLVAQHNYFHPFSKKAWLPQYSFQRNYLFMPFSEIISYQNCSEWIFSLIAINFSKIQSYCNEWDRSVI